VCDFIPHQADLAALRQLTFVDPATAATIGGDGNITKWWRFEGTDRFGWPELFSRLNTLPQSRRGEARS
jgi:hypothetical protein